jgi:hypothetical protein
LLCDLSPWFAIFRRGMPRNSAETNSMVGR